MESPSARPAANKTMPRMKNTPFHEKSPNIETTSQADVFGRRADQNLKAAGFDRPLHVPIENHQILRTQRELNASLFARFQAHSFKSSQNRLVVNDSRHIRRKIKLDDFIARGGAGIFHVERYLDVSGSLLRSWRDFQVGITVRRVAESVAKRIKRPIHQHFLFLTVETGRWNLRTPFVWEVQRNLADGLGKCDRELTRGIVIAEQDVGDGGAAVFTLKPGLDDGRYVSIDPVNRQGPAVKQHDDGRLSGFFHGLAELQLKTGQLETRARLTFADQIRVFPQHDDGRVHLTRHIPRLVEFGLFALIGWNGHNLAIGKSCIDEFTTLGILHLHAGSQLLANPIEHRDDVQIRRPVAALRVFSLGRIGPGDENRLQILP